MRSLWLTSIGLSLICIASCGGSGSFGSQTFCSDPVPVLGTFDPAAPGYIVLFQDGVDGQAETSRLSTLHGFQPTHVFQSIQGFSAEFSADILEQLRCEPSSKSIGHDQVSYPA